MINSPFKSSKAISKIPANTLLFILTIVKQDNLLLRISKTKKKDEKFIPELLTLVLRFRLLLK